MGVLSRGFKNAFRNSIRTLSIVLILAISIAMALVMLMALKTVQNKISSVKSSVGNVITISPAGMRGFEGSGTLLTDENANDIRAIDHVSSVIETLSSRLTTIGSDTSSSPFGRDNTDSNAQTSLSAPDMQAPSSDSNSSGSGGRGRFFVNGQRVDGSNSFSMPITVTGINDLSNLSALEASSFSVTSGENIDATSSENVAMLGQDLATKNNISAGDTFTAYGQTITVKGIFDAGNTFANSRIIMPIATLQNLSGNTGDINSIIVTTDSVDTLSSVQSAIQDKLGSSVDVTSSEDSANNIITPLENIKSISLYSLIGALVAGSVIIFLTMVMIVRERRREIGVLKAIGASNISIVSQFTVESLVLTLTSSIAGVVVGIVLSNPVLSMMTSNSESSSVGSNTVRGAGVAGRQIMRMGSEFGAGAQNAVRNLHAIIGWDILLYGILAAIAIAIIGSFIPAFAISKVRPAEVLRSE